MYQVDFVAALFGAFLLLWISKAGGGLSYDDAVPGVVVVQAWCPNDNTSILPLGSTPRCASDAIVGTSNPTLGLVACRSLALNTTAVTLPVEGLNTDATKLGLSPPPVTTSVIIGEFKFHDANGVEIPGFKFSGLATPQHLTPSRFAVGYGPTTQPAFVSISPPTHVLITIDCKEILGSICPSVGKFAMVRAPYKTYHGQFTVKVHSDEWVLPCVTNVSVKPDGIPVPLSACGP